MAAPASDVHAGDDLGDRATPLSGTQLWPEPLASRPRCTEPAGRACARRSLTSRLALPAPHAGSTYTCPPTGRGRPAGKRCGPPRPAHPPRPGPDHPAPRGTTQGLEVEEPVQAGGPATPTPPTKLARQSTSPNANQLGGISMTCQAVRAVGFRAGGASSKGRLSRSRAHKTSTRRRARQMSAWTCLSPSLRFFR